MSEADGRQVRWNRHNAQRRDDILSAAGEVIRSAPPGAEFHVAQVAKQAGLSRTVLYRHFEDRADLDTAIQGHIFELLGYELVPALTFDGTPMQIIERIVTAYVTWADANPALHRFVEQPVPGHESAALDRAVTEIAKQIEAMIYLGMDLVDATLDDADRRSVDPLVFSLVGQGFSAVRRWLSIETDRAEPSEFIDLLSELIWHQIAGLVSKRGGHLAPDVPVQDLLEAAAQ